MKIAMEGLQQKLEDKDKEQDGIHASHEARTAELKQDKKRYEELLAMKEKDLERQTDKAKEMEKKAKELEGGMGKL